MNHLVSGAGIDSLGGMEGLQPQVDIPAVQFPGAVGGVGQDPVIVLRRAAVLEGHQIPVRRGHLPNLRLGQTLEGFEIIVEQVDHRLRLPGCGLGDEGYAVLPV